ncbi:MarR family winged helix-turn-helix transcriptional regulator [Ruegeria sp. EL01]|jgi:DNA-binding MarR family transcriptional regulator|uniref:MarR family winged helix-turn-helix transcriptional regulator n=1 Tax=Ruegeria sp. EL01 TaxID=2107578 RepID=UPI000EA831E0|nr:MarR family transcriptional regulator [Ruegeria sp. EL01]
MIQSTTTGLGEVLRHLTDLLDRGSQEAYRNAGLSYRPRCTPIMRALDGQPVSVSELCNRLHITQGAISQTVKRMEADGLIDRIPTDDSRSRAIILTPDGSALREALVAQWQLRLAAVSELETEIGAPLRTILKDAICALEHEGFAERLARLSTGTADD